MQKMLKMLQKLRIIARLPGRFLRWRRAYKYEKRWRNLVTEIEKRISEVNQDINKLLKVRVVRVVRKTKKQREQEKKIKELRKIRRKLFQKHEELERAVEARINTTDIRYLLLVSSLEEISAPL